MHLSKILRNIINLLLNNDVRLISLDLDNTLLDWGDRLGWSKQNFFR